MTIRDAIACDGRFEELGEFKLEDASNSNESAFSVDKIDAHNEEIFRIGFEKMKPQKTPQQKRGQKRKKTQGASVQSEQEKLEKVKALVETEGKHLGDIVRKLVEEEKNEDLQIIYQLLQKQYPDLSKTMLERFTKESFAETLKKVDFGKAQQSFSDVLRLEKLIEHGESVCKLENYILTNAHVFDGVVLDNILDSNVIVTAVFGYKNPNQEGIVRFTVNKNIIDIDRQQDYAVLEFQVPEQDEAKVPPGLMMLFSPMPKSGEACIVGHPDSGVQKIDPTCIIEKELRIKEAPRSRCDASEGLSCVTASAAPVQTSAGLCPPRVGSLDARRGPGHESLPHHKTPQTPPSSGHLELPWLLDFYFLTWTERGLEQSCEELSGLRVLAAPCGLAFPAAKLRAGPWTVSSTSIPKLQNGTFELLLNPPNNNNCTFWTIVPRMRKGLQLWTKEQHISGLKWDEKTMAEQQVTSEDDHSHKFKMKFHNSKDTHTIHCERPQTVLEAIKFKMGSQFNDQRLTLMIIRDKWQTSIPTHFPCCLLRNRELVTLRENAKEVEDRGKVDHPVSHDEQYYTVFIETKPGINAKTKRVFKSSS
ncbi:hypothetical protein WMY93_007933 [Mugilogobius chulae]|uniref:Uncharacterized protein n=1 Tax=Mugilogobius chulae TaxID=88201 RepID=A0AAW0PEJ6_9GOBI